MFRISRIGIAVALAASVTAVVAAQSKTDQTFGAGVTLVSATPIAAIYEKPDEFVGKTIRLDGVVTAVCEAMGCWVALADSESPDRAVRFKVDHESGIVFPITLEGKRASAEGVFEKIASADKEANEAAGEHASHQPAAAAFGKQYQIKATGAVVR